MNIYLFTATCHLLPNGNLVLLWLKKRERRLRDTPKATEQDWFNGIFHGNGSESTDKEKSIRMNLIKKMTATKQRHKESSNISSRLSVHPAAM